ncbi:hypothetical protein C4097_07105 [Clostridioides difficile]|uniref:hypothetical protein n=1 Tax=unclassified Clostridioides TaxID=2635829 RepID=UPI001CA54458|nr:hypothetical protein [Clostridioides difficile]MDB3084328.1 hypothetical protein [Clostridioides difficile]MDI0268078.1 hypothetical protein [Clostridioides difficile]MDI7817509.1 hypothetical protein [Clostridioides difficile]
MKKKSSFRQIVFVNTVRSIPIVFIRSVVALIMPLYLIYFVVSTIVNPVATRLVEIRQSREYANYNMENG